MIAFAIGLTLALASSCGADESGPTVSAAGDDSGIDPDAENDVADSEVDSEQAEAADSAASSTKPTEIAIPGIAPDELTITVLTQGDGPEAREGDTVIVDYVGVRSLDGVEFDASYDRAPFAVAPLGSANVIQGWNDGLLGARQGSRIQLDIPSDLAYGPSARSEVIRENEPLTFVIDVRAVVGASDPADAPIEPGVSLSTGATELTIDDLRVGDGDELEMGQTAIFDLVLFRADTGEMLDSTWGIEALRIPMTADGFPALVDGMPGMAIGGRRAITFPPEMGFGPEGSPAAGLPPGVDATIVVDLYAAY